MRVYVVAVLLFGWGTALLVGLFSPWIPVFASGLLFGGTWVLALYIWDEPPDRIARWLRGAEGERATGKALRPLTSRGWHVRHDLAARRGNVDHVVAGPGGVFVLETKKLNGRLVVTDGVLNVRFDQSPINDYALTSLAPAVHRFAGRLRDHLHSRLGWIVDVYPVVVLVSEAFEQGRVTAGRLTYIRVDQLAHWLEQQPRRIAEQDLAQIGAALAALPSAKDIPYERGPEALPTPEI
jgi:hypothetical protein